MDKDLYQIFKTYHFPGETSPGYMDSDMAYLEDIRELPPFQEQLQREVNIFLFCDKGKIEARVNGHTFTVKEKQLFICPSGLPLSDYMVSPDLRCRIFCITDRLLRSLLRNRMDIWNRAIYLDKLNIIDFSDEEFAKVADYYYTLLKYKIDHPEYLLQKEIITALLQAIIIDFCAFFLFKTEEDPQAESVGNAEKIYNRFMVLLSRTTIKKRSVGYYAQQLCITPKYLSKLCKQASGKSAHQWIEEAVREDIKHALKDPDRPIKEVVADLGFGTSSFFGKFVKEQFGLTPVQLREQLLGEEA